MTNENALTAEITYDGLIGGIKLNGEDFSQSVSSITYRHRAGELPVLILELNPEHAELKAVVGSVLLKEKTADPVLALQGQRPQESVSIPTLEITPYNQEKIQRHFQEQCKSQEH